MSLKKMMRLIQIKPLIQTKLNSFTITMNTTYGSKESPVRVTGIKVEEFKVTNLTSQKELTELGMVEPVPGVYAFVDMKNIKPKDIIRVWFTKKGYHYMTTSFTIKP